MDHFFEEQLHKWLPDYATRKSRKHSSETDASHENAAKRSKAATAGDEEDVILA